MEKMKKDGGQAFPVYSLVFGTTEGMSLRDWFAGMALMGYRSRDLLYNSDQVSDWSYRDADAMIKERERLEGK